MKKFTIICPVFNEELAIPLFFKRMEEVINKINDRYLVDLLFINNASQDNTLEIIKGIKRQYNFVQVITLSKNFGYQASLECGLRNAKGQVLAFIDVDCEDPPEMLIKFLNLYEEGYQIVYGIRSDRVENALIKLMRKYFYHLIKLFSDDEIILYMAEFSLFTSEVRKCILEDRNSFPFIRASIARVGFRRIGVPYKRDKRIIGETHYNFLGMVIFAISGILSSTTLPLRLPIYFLPFFLVATIYLGWRAAILGGIIEVTQLLTFVLAYIGANVAFIGLYVARIYKNSLRRPNYFINKELTLVNE